MSTNHTHRVLVMALLLLSSTFSAFAVNISAIRTGNWNATNTWSTNKVPTAADNVTIPSPFNVTVNVTTAVCTNLTVNSGGTLSISANDKLSIGGSLSNAGTFTAVANSTLTFNGASNATITGGGTYTITGTVVLNMGAAGTLLDVQDAKFITGINSGAKYYFTFTRGTWKMDNSGALNDAYNSGSANTLTIPFGVIIESDAGTMNLATKGTTGNVRLSGELYINGGAVNVQTAQTTNSGQDLEYTVNGGTPQLYIGGGTLTVGAGFNARTGSDYIDFHMTGGTMLVASRGSTTNSTFQLQDVTGGKTYMSGGVIVVQEPCAGNSGDLDMGGANVAATLYSVTGGTVQLGNSSSESNSDYFAIQAYPTTNYPHIDCEPGVAKTIGINNSGSINMLSLKINTHATFDATQFTSVRIDSSNSTYALDDEGTLTSGTIIFSGSVPQVITSSSLSNLPINNLQIANTGGNVILNIPTTVGNQLSFTSGLLDASANPLTLTTGSNAITGASSSSYVITGDGVTETGYLAIKGLSRNTTTLFPIGNANYYLPATINPGNNSNTAYSASVYQGVTLNGLSTGTPLSQPVLDAMADVTWNLTRTAGSGSAALGLNWASTGTTLEGAAFQLFGSNIGITQFTGGTWQTTNGSGNVATEMASTTFSSFSQFSIAGTPVTLPVVLTDFKAMSKGKTADLSWTLSSDLEATTFTVERSVDGSHWTNIGVVQGDAGVTGESSYSFTDVSPATGLDYYRLLIQSTDGATTYSPIRTVAFAALARVNVYPVPANTGFTVSVGATDRRLSIRLINPAGELLQSKVLDGSGGGNVTMNTGDYPAGMYFVEVMDGASLLQTIPQMVVH